eukprot:jgi/Mesen1/6141/ME000314S05147
MAQKKAKYDRQLRIWGEHGQALLENSKICLLNCGPTGSEALKNLVLGGIGSFTIADGTKVEAADLGNNYLVDYDSLGKSKAKAVSALLQELNDSVVAKFVEESPEALIETNPGFFADFTLVIATQMTEAALIKLDAICRQHGVQLLIARSYGLAGLVRISVEEHCVIESKPDNVVDDLRLHKPWPELQQFANMFDIDTDDAMIHSHIPWGVILIKLANEWKEENAGALPSTSKQRQAFKETIAGRQREVDEDNYKEALASAFKVWAPSVISSDLQAILNDKAAEVTPSSSIFWVMVAALKEFVANEGGRDLPLDGSIPDMHSMTEYYIGLQKVYQARAEADVAAVEARVRDILKRIGRDPQVVPRAHVKHFCKNARHLRVLRYKTLTEEYSNRSGPELQRLLSVEDSNNAALYVLLRAADHFAAAYNRFPGVFDGDAEEEDVTRLKAVAMSLLNDAGAGSTTLPEDLISEICRFGAGELHCAAAVVGGIASQEAIKLITGQFTPLGGTLIYNAMASTSSCLTL